MTDVAAAQEQRPKLAICASFTAEPLEGPLRFWLQKLGLDLELEFAPYAQVFQELLDPTSLLSGNRAGLNLLLVRPEDWGREKALGAADVEAHTRELEGALAGFAGRSGVPLILGLFPASPQVAAPLAPAIDEAASRLRNQASELAGCHRVEMDDALRYRPAEIFDPVQEDMGHIPFSEEMFAALATAIARKVHALLRPAHKVLVLDCDNTLWRGVVGEEGPAGLILEPGFEALQNFAIAQQEQGVLVSLCSKNAEADVLEAFEQRPDFPLRPSHLVASRINWEPKAANLASLASELNLGLDSFVFVDDNPVECAAVRATLPQVVTLQLTSPEAVPHLIENLWAFDRLQVTEEDRQRTEMYRQNTEREQSLQQSQSIEDFLDTLQLEIDFASPAEDEWARVAQLTVRTNQFNFTTRRRTEAEVRGLADDGYEVMRVRVKDRFGDYGIVGVVFFRESDGALEVDTLLVSCRVLGRGVEHAILRKLGERAGELGLDLVTIPFAKTAKNEPALAFIEQVASAHRQGSGDTLAFHLPQSFAQDIKHRPGLDAEEVVEAQKGTRKASGSAPATGEQPKWQVYTEIAFELSSAQEVVAAVAASLAAPRPLEADPEPAATPTEERLLTLWRRLFRIQDLGVSDPYFDLGGTSLLAVQLFAEIEAEFGRRLPLTTILELGTIRALAAELDGVSTKDQEATSQVGAVCLRRATAPGPEPRSLFLIHDGDGEVLLYRNLASRIPEDLAVFGLMPKREAGVALAHGNIEAMARHYVELIRAEQPEGPYALGGMCAGGTLAFEVAVQLQRAGQEIGLVAVMDAAAPGAKKRPGLLTSRRWERFVGALRGGRPSPSPEVQDASEPLPNPRDTETAPASKAGIARIAGTLFEKAGGLIRYELSHRQEASQTLRRFRALRDALASGRSPSADARLLSVRDIYDLAESDYVPGRLESDRVVLVRATEGDGSDEPYVRLYEEPDFGWQSYVSLPVRVVDVAGGHASMLQEPHVQDLAAVVTSHLQSGEGE